MTQPHCPHATQLIAVKSYGTDTVELSLSRPTGFEWRAGDYLWLMHSDLPAKPFSIANQPSDPSVRLQIARTPTINPWLDGFIAQKTGHISTAMTQFHWPTSELPIVCFAGGTGITPLMALLQAHLATHSLPVMLYWGIRQEKLAYLAPELDHLQHSYPHFTYQLIISADPDARVGLIQGLIPELLRQEQLPLPNTLYDALICGPWGMVNAIREALPQAHIHSLQT